MVSAEQDQVVQGRVAAVGPVLEVVGVAGHRWSSAVREPAVGVSGDEGLPDGCGDQALGAADVEDLRGRAEDGGDQVGVAADPPDRGGGELGTGLGDRETTAVAESLVGHGQGEPRDGAVGLREHLGALERAAPLDEGVEEAGAVVAGVAAVVATAGDRTRGRVTDRSGGGVGCGERDQGRLDQLCVLDCCTCL